MVGGPPKCGTQIGEFHGEPRVCLALAGAVPQRQDLRLTAGEVARMRRAGRGNIAASDQLIFGELANRFQHRIPGMPRRPVGDEKRLAHQGVEQIQNRELVVNHRSQL